ncbi:MAG: RecQ family ATP-dependent DNA helicase [Lentisphaeraceae bacterium]|nr:RecQ family ATP-dependent DNA helicase [Lentisphaeraceae bacterium]
MKEQLHQALKKFFGFDEFLDGQYKAIAKFNEGKDVCLVMPTGAGKSICYQLPALLKPGYTIVISPLIALMKDQVDNLQRKGIPAIYINSSLTPREQHENMQRVMRGEAKLLYVAPERLKAANFRQAIINQPPDCLVVDEAHCISEWGHDFSPDYKRLGEFCQTYKIPQVCAFTATATPLVREDIKKQLKRDDMEFMVTGFTRPNLSFSVVEANGARKKDILRK